MFIASNFYDNVDCEGCGIKHRCSSYLFAKREPDDTLTKIMMGSHCGSKVSSLIHLFHILNGIQFLPEDISFMENACALINYWSRNSLNEIAEMSAREFSDVEADDV